MRLRIPSSSAEASDETRGLGDSKLLSADNRIVVSYQVHLFTKMLMIQIFHLMFVTFNKKEVLELFLRPLSSTY